MQQCLRFSDGLDVIGDLPSDQGEEGSGQQSQQMHEDETDDHLDHQDALRFQHEIGNTERVASEDGEDDGGQMEA